MTYKRCCDRIVPMSCSVANAVPNLSPPQAVALQIRSLWLKGDSIPKSASFDGLSQQWRTSDALAELS